MRIEYFLTLNSKKKNSLMLFIIKWMRRQYSFKYGIQIPGITHIGKGFYIGHFGTIVVNSNAIIGDNVNISQGVTIGQANRGRNKGAPIIGNEVYIGPGAIIIGNVKIGNKVAIGANAVVTQDVPEGAVVGGVPAKIISMNGSESYINRKV
ncbi:MAG: serine acetyltransferase [Porphyromonadaceae bacterium]|nr:serine acetyltransferase [Porphyromonadaceae bacterium]